MIEFDPSDDFFLLLSANESSTVHLYSKKDDQYLSKRKAFRQAAKRDIDRALAEGGPMTQWISIDKEVLSKKTGSSDGSKLVSNNGDEYDEAKVLAVFGVHQPITFYGFLNMKISIEFPISQSGDHMVEDAVEAILIEKEKRIKNLLPTVTCS